SGQSCVAGSRGLVQRGILESLVARIAERAGSITVGDPLDPATHVGPLCTRAQIERIEATLAQAVSQGATIHFGGAPLDRPGNYMQPTLVECPGPDISTLEVEMFGPVMSLLPFDTEEDAIRLANDTVFGLGSGVFTNSLARAHRVSSRLRAGICWVNTYRAISPIAPFGGFGHSGFGREGGIEAVLDYTRTKTTWINTADAPMANPFTMR
ncbi:MAG: aldehyde dehydrogenase family protein, partial [Boseongicola sp. SB0670_bin_30]|nr:aldehyde dehydrogenase family protein [Boseongicola sp. SB0670_bin_30]